MHISQAHREVTERAETTRENQGQRLRCLECSQ